MQRDFRVLLWDAQDAALRVLQFVDGRTRQEYARDVMLRSAVERQRTIVGEAMSQLARYFPEVAQQIAELPEIVGFRNVLVHGYAVIDDDRVWRIVTARIAPLVTSLTTMLDEVPE